MRAWISRLVFAAAVMCVATPAAAQRATTLDCSPAYRTWEVTAQGLDVLRLQDLTPHPDGMRLQIDFTRNEITLGRNTLPITIDDEWIISAYYQPGATAAASDLISILEINRRTGSWMTRRVTGEGSTMVARYSQGTCRTTDGRSQF